MDADKNAKILDQELNWFGFVLNKRIQDYFNPEHQEKMLEFFPPRLEISDTWYGTFIKKYGFSPSERIVLMLALASEVRPQLLDILFSKNKMYNRGFTEFGGVVDNRHAGFIPTIQTALFILAGDDLVSQFSASTFFDRHHPFRRQAILDLDTSNKYEPFTSSPLRLSRDTFSYFTTGQDSETEFSTDFPAVKMETMMEWDDLVLSPDTYDQLMELRAWLTYGDELLDNWDINKHIRPGYRVLFYGPPGTGKSLTASLLGKLSTRPVYRIDLSQIISRYIGETEKKLERIFMQAEQKNWILFFDEADSLFGKRTQVSDVHDRYAGTSYFLQRLEDCSNVLILASNNVRSNLDEAFTRRFQSTVYFPMPEKKERYKLWSALSSISELENNIDLDNISEKYKLAGGAIVNVIRYCTLMAIKRRSNTISDKDLLIGIQREYSKEGRTM